ncbi:GyrI-like domain-containing protein [Dietzia cinnamea]|uniref:Effector-binding domain-containing protein n=1 Tax=Dietzia cinnamea TaxID=321318 RepID=A0A4V2W838_9ACTN|nr:GyrI-like domain-containing protein [Dietzia cinnamea]TCW24415.1 effector-binding domain-containing protein [Dietzia cinnamea]
MSSSSSSPHDQAPTASPHDQVPTAPTDPPSGYPDLGADPIDGVRLLRAPAVPTAVVRVAGVPMSELTGVFDSVFGTVLPRAFEAGLAPAGPPIALYTAAVEGPDSVVDLEIGFPLRAPLAEQVGTDPIEVDGRRIVASELPAGEIAVISHVGSYDDLGRAWGDFMGEIAGMGRASGLPFWESYVTEPSPDMDPATLRTDLFCAVRTPDDAA